MYLFMDGSCLIRLSICICSGNLKSDGFLNRAGKNLSVHFKCHSLILKLYMYTFRSKEGVTFSYLNAFIDSFIKYLCACYPRHCTKCYIFKSEQRLWFLFSWNEKGERDCRDEHRSVCLFFSLSLFHSVA